MTPLFGKKNKQAKLQKKLFLHSCLEEEKDKSRERLHCSIIY